jgi:predicted Zn-dependent protease
MKSIPEIESILRGVIAAAAAPQAQAVFAAGRELTARFGDNAVTQHAIGENHMLTLSVAFDRRHGSASTNKLDPESLAALARRARDIAMAMPEDPESMPPVGLQDYPDIPSRFDAALDTMEPDTLARQAAAAIAAARRHGMSASGLASAGTEMQALANSNGLFVCDRRTEWSFSTTLRSPHGVGSAERTLNHLQPEAVDSAVEEALATACAMRDPAKLEPGEWTVIFEPRATRDFLEPIWRWGALSAREAEEGATPFAGAVGRPMFDPRVNLRTAIDDPDLPPRLFGQDGLAMRATDWIRNGVVERLHHNRYWADVKKTYPDPAISPIQMTGEDLAIDDLVRQCGRGLLVKRLWYIRPVDRKELLLTGMTRDGLFLVEDGKVTRPVRNMRFNESPMVFLRNILAMSRPQRIGDAKLPGIMARDFTFSGVTESQ